MSRSLLVLWPRARMRIKRDDDSSNTNSKSSSGSDKNNGDDEYDANLKIVAQCDPLLIV